MNVDAWQTTCASPYRRRAASSDSPTVPIGGCEKTTVGTISYASLSRAAACMVKCSETGDFGAAWRGDRGLPVGSETRGRSSRVRRATSRLQMQPEEPVVAGRGPAKRPL